MPAATRNVDAEIRMDEFSRTLKIIIQNLEGKDFAVLGTYNLYLQGINVVPNDLDFIADNEVIFEVGRKFESKIKMNEQGFIETEFSLEGVGVHFVGSRGNEVRPPFRENTVWVENDGIRIPCLSLKAELDFYIYKQREKDRGKVELIKERMRI